MARITKDQLDPRNNLQYYTKAALKNVDLWDDRTVRAEYARLRDISQKRLKRLAKEEPESYAYQANVGKYAPTKTLTTAEIKELLPGLAKFIAAKTGTVRGIRAQRERAVESLQELGYTEITPANIKQFGEYMEAWRSSKQSRSKGSPNVAAYFEFLQQRDIPWEKVKEDFKHWIMHMEALEKYVTVQEKKTGEPVTAEDIVAEYERLENKRKLQNEQRREARKRKRGS